MESTGRLDRGDGVEMAWALPQVIWAWAPPQRPATNSVTMIE